MGRPAARLTDPVTHMMTPLNPGPGSPNVLIGKLPAWRGLPAAAAAALQSAQSAAAATITGLEATTASTAGTPAGPAAYTAEQTGKAAALASLSSMMAGMAAPNASGGTPDLHICPMPTPVPPHGPGYVIDGSQTVLTNGLPQCRQEDHVLEALGGMDPIALGLMTVLVGG
jgi:uncharacterized Zn-binding protein involved in type VI secretion